MIDDAITELEPLVGTREACAATGRPQANHYRRHRKSPVPARPPRERMPQPRALRAAERAEVRAVLNSEKHVDKAPAVVYHELLDAGTYLASISTMYRIAVRIRRPAPSARGPLHVRPAGSGESWRRPVPRSSGIP
ncbi:MAG: hypothetical protein GEU74_14760 [Nitriliruptorales bacterium]|nr:hypothetical protein [Nitriliruptorales bacterium]